MTQTAERTAAEVDARFDELQTKLVPLWRSIERMSQDEQTIVVVPSMSVDVAASGAEMQIYEERFLFLLLLLRQPRARLVYVTSRRVLAEIIDYYLDLIPGLIPSHARPRLHLVSPLDGSARPLTDKLLERPRLLAQIRGLIADPDRAHLVPYNTTELEQELAVRLGIPMYAADPRYFPLGTKSGCRRLFAEEGVVHPIGVEDLGSIDDLVEAICSLRAEKPSLEEVLVKLNEGVSGEGNALVQLRDLPEAGAPGEAEAIRKRVNVMSFELKGATYDGYAAKLDQRGAIVEERITGEEFRSPSVQLRVTPLGKVELLSTHDQVLGGPSGQSYMGCRFPADPGYAATITKAAAKVGNRLAREGVIGRFAIDFVTVRKADGGWEPYAIELNLRKGGTTHPFLTLQFLTDGTYDPERAVFTAPDGREKCFVASDYLKNEVYRRFTPADLFDIVVRHGLHFDPSRQTGVVFHMMGALGELGRLGLTAVGNTQEDAEAIYERAVKVLDQEAEESGTQPI
jgi:hypothetical protein